MKSLVVKPDGWPCSLVECPPGFFVFEGNLCLKTEYGLEDLEVFNCGGEVFWGGAKTKEERRTLIVQPAYCEWEERE